jgi:hypothetical protein
LPVGTSVELDELDDASPSEGAEIAMRSSGGRRRNLVIGVAVALVVTAVVVLGTTGSGRSAAPPTTPPTTSAGAPDTTVDTAPLKPTIIGTGRPLLGEPSGLALLLVSYDGQLNHLDLDTGQLDVTHLSSPGGESQAWYLTDQGLIYGDGKSLVLRMLDGTERSIAFSQTVDSYNTYSRASAGQIWAMTQSGQDGALLLRIDLATAAVVERIPIGSAYLVGADEIGRPLLQLGDGMVWRLAADGQWSTFGSLPTRPIGHGLYLNTTCPQPPACIVQVRTGDHKVLYTVPPLDTEYAQDVAAGASNGTLTALVRASVGGPSQAIDVYGPDGSRVVTLSDFSLQYSQDGSGMSWSPDGVWLFWFGAIAMHAWRAGLDAPLSIDLSSLSIAMQHLAVTRSH